MTPRGPKVLPATKTLAAMIAERGYTQSRVARVLKMSHNTLYGWCRGLRRPWPSKAARLARWLGVTTDQVMAAWAAGVSERR